MTKEQKEKKQERKAVIRAQRKVFKQNTDKLFAHEYRYSERFERSHVQDDGRAYINVDLTKVDTPFSIFSYNTRINQEIYDYIDSEAFYLRAAIPIVVNFDDGGKYDDELKEKIRRSVIRHYTLQYEDKRLDFRRNRILAWIILAIGAVFLSLYITLTLTFETALGVSDNVILEIICIMAWVFVWEATDRFFFTGTERKVDLMNAGQLALIDVTFGEPVYHERVDK